MSVEPFKIAIADDVLQDVARRLEMTRWPHDMANDDWRYGANAVYLKEVVDYWRNGYDWREQERRMNSYQHFKTTIDEVPIHFIHEPGKGPNPIPLILTHGWPWTFWDFEKVIGPLTDPAAHGLDPAISFDVVVPSLPGFGFSTPLRRTGINFQKTADLWVRLMREELGYDTFAAQGGDWGQLVTSQMAHRYPQHLLGIHLSLSLPLNFFEAGIPALEDYAEDEIEYFHHTAAKMEHCVSHLAVQTREPQTLSYAMHDSPVGLLAWLIDRRRWWGHTEGNIESRFSKDDSITLTMLYWVTESFVTSARFYWEAANDLWQPSHDRRPVIEVPTGMAVFPDENLIMPKEWMEEYYNLVHLTYMKSGGHFAPVEEPEALAEDIRAFFSFVR